MSSCSRQFTFIFLQIFTPQIINGPSWMKTLRISKRGEKFINDLKTKTMKDFSIIVTWKLKNFQWGFRRLCWLLNNTLLPNLPHPVQIEHIPNDNSPLGLFRLKLQTSLPGSLSLLLTFFPERPLSLWSQLSCSRN